MSWACLTSPGWVAEASFTSWGDLLLDWDVLMAVDQLGPERGDRFRVSQAIELRRPVDIATSLDVSRLIGPLSIVVAIPIEGLEHDINSPTYVRAEFDGEAVVSQAVPRPVI